MRGVPYSDEYILGEARMILSDWGSTYKVAEALGITQSTVWYHLAHRLPGVDMTLYTRVSRVLQLNYKGGGR